MIDHWDIGCWPLLNNIPHKIDKTTLNPLQAVQATNRQNKSESTTSNKQTAFLHLIRHEDEWVKRISPDKISLKWRQSAREVSDRHGDSTRLAFHFYYITACVMHTTHTSIKNMSCTNVFMILYMTPHIKRYQLSENMIFSYGVQSKNISKFGPKVDFEISHIWNLQCLLSKLLKDFM